MRALDLFCRAGQTLCERCLQTVRYGRLGRVCYLLAQASTDEEEAKLMSEKNTLIQEILQCHEKNQKGEIQ